jgi:hypothetical protein
MPILHPLNVFSAKVSGAESGPRWFAPAEGFLINFSDTPIGVSRASSNASMSDFRTTVLGHFAAADSGKRRTFVTSGVEGTHVVVRELLNACKEDLFIFARRLSPLVHSPAMLRNVAASDTAPRMRLLLDHPPGDDPMLYEIGDLISERGAIEVRWSPVPSAVHFIVVDGRHIRLERDADGQTAIIDLNAEGEARDALMRLNKLWHMSKAMDSAPKMREVTQGLHC